MKRSPSRAQLKKTSRSGFTLIEVIIALTLLGILAGMTGMFLTSSYRETAQADERSRDELDVVSTMERMIAVYKGYCAEDESTAANQLAARISSGAFGSGEAAPSMQKKALTLPNNAGATGSLLFVTVRRGTMELTYVFQ